MSVTGMNIIGALLEMLEDIHTCELDYDLQILYVIEGPPVCRLRG